MELGDLVYDSVLKMRGLVIEILNSAVPYRVLYEDGQIDFACSHDLEKISGYLI